MTDGLLRRGARRLRRIMVKIARATPFFPEPDKSYVATERYRSICEDIGGYVPLVEKAVRDYAVFSKFKSYREYQIILEHVTFERGLEYLAVIKRQSPDLLDKFEQFKANDLVGSPTLHSFGSLGQVSPSTLRYVKVASDLRTLFGDLTNKRIVEIGGGYGGQLLILDRLYRFSRYLVLDLQPVLQLISKYLDSHLLNASYATATLNQIDGQQTYDLAISNYAFSELPKELQLRYVEKILSKSERGYLTMNDIIPGKNLSLAELRQVLPPFEIKPEEPLTHPNNYLIVWGHQR